MSWDVADKGVRVECGGGVQVEPGQQKKRRGPSVAAHGRAGIPTLMNLDLDEWGGAHPRTTNLHPADMSPPTPEDNIDFLHERWGHLGACQVGAPGGSR